MMVFDLDPGPPADIVQCCEVGLVLRGLFEGVGLRVLAKTSGSKGLQIYVPLNIADATYDETKTFSKAVAELLEAQMPELVVSRMTKTLRGGKVLVDWSQNDEHKTTVNVYSVRARERPTVSTPVPGTRCATCLDAGDAGVLSVRHRAGARARRRARRPVRLLSHSAEAAGSLKPAAVMPALSDAVFPLDRGTGREEQASTPN